MNAVAEAPRPVVREYTPDELTQIGRQLPERVVGPRAFSGSLRKFLALTWMLAYLEFKLKFFQIDMRSFGNFKNGFSVK